MYAYYTMRYVCKIGVFHNVEQDKKNIQSPLFLSWPYILPNISYYKYEHLLWGKKHVHLMWMNKSDTSVLLTPLEAKSSSLRSHHTSMHLPRWRRRVYCLCYHSTGINSSLPQQLAYMPMGIKRTWKTKAAVF